MRIHTQEENFEYRMKDVLEEVLSGTENDIENMEPNELENFLWQNLEELGQRVYESMFEWMSPEDWLKLLKGE